MLLLETPITIGTHTYDALVPMRGSWDLRTRTIELTFGLAINQMSPTRIRVGKRKAGNVVVSPALIYTVTLSDLAETNDDFSDLMDKLQTWHERGEQLLDLSAITYQNGEEEVALTSVFLTAAGQAYSNEEP